MDFFTINREKKLEKEAPLAERMRPRSLSEIAGQKHILAPGSALDRQIRSDRLSSMIFYGPPGTGKTTLAEVIAKTTQMHFEKISAVVSGVKDMRDHLEAAKERLGYDGVRTILFVDEIHRFNKAQQDLLLPYVEQGLVILIGATTENPYFEVNAALLSRARVIELMPLEEEDLEAIVDRALTDSDRGLGQLAVSFEGMAKKDLVRMAGGDARVLLNTLEVAVLSTPQGPDGIIIDREALEASSQRTISRYDKDGDMHYDVVSAFIKSMRGSDPDATVYYLARMIEAGEDPRFIGRRILIHACEDVGLADPMAIVVAQAAFQAAHVVGFPEARLILAEAALYIACAPKSNASYKAIGAAQAYVRANPNQPVPNHLRDASYKGAKNLGRGEGYKYPHDYEGAWTAQDYLPQGALGQSFYRPSDRGRERLIKDYLDSHQYFDSKDQGEGP